MNRIDMLRLVFAATAVFGATAHAQAFHGDTVARDSSAAMVRVGDNVYAILHDDATAEWPHGNTGVVVGRDAVLVIDSNYLPIRAEQDIALIRRLTPKPVRYLVNTHWHGDHTHGNGVYTRAFPGIAIIGARETVGFIELNLVKYPAGALAPTSAKRAALARLEATLARGADSAGQAFSADLKRRLATDVAQRRVELEQLARVAVAPPTHLFDADTTIDLGDRRVELRNLGRANSPADVVVWVPDARALFAGDILVHPVPYTILASALPWIGALERVERYPVSALVPGHGPAMRTHAYTRLVRETFEAARARIDSMYRRGVGLDSARRTLNLSDFRGRFLTLDGQPASDAEWEYFTRSVAEQMATCVHGYRC